MKNFIEKLSRETGKLEKYELIELTEEVKIKKEIFEITHKYYKRLSDDELFEPFEDPDYNLNIDYNLHLDLLRNSSQIVIKTGADSHFLLLMLYNKSKSDILQNTKR